MRLLFLFFVYFFCFSNCFSQDKVIPISHLRLNNDLANRLDLTYNNRILGQDVDRLVSVFKLENRTETRLWQSEFWGKWFTSAVLAYRINPSEQLFAKLKYAVESLMNTQTDDGYIGNYDINHRLEQWDIWGRKYCLLGLLDYYELTNDRKVLGTALRLADNLIDDLNNSDKIIVTKGNYRGMAASSVLEPMVKLYKLSKKKKYLNFAELIVAQWSSSDGPQLIEKSNIDVANRFEKPTSWYSWEQGQKAYEMMSCYEGLLELFRITQNPIYKDAVVQTWQNIFETEINIAGSGASTEMWFGGKNLQAKPIHHYQEVCVTVTWIKLSLQLFRLTGEYKYIEAAEIAYYNALLGSLDPTANFWAKYTPLTGQRLPGSEQCGMGMNCCEASGPRALFLIPFYTLSNSKDTVSVNLYNPGIYSIDKDSEIEILSEYPKKGKIKLVMKSKKNKFFPLKLRIPSWTKKWNCSVNGGNLSSSGSLSGYYTISRDWVNGDVIELDLELTGRIVQEGDGDNTNYAIMRGPILLSRDSYFDEKYPMGIILQPVQKDNENVDIQEVNIGDHTFYKVMFIPESYSEYGADPIEILMTDYASAGYLKNKSFFQSWFPQLVHRK